jgi:hypothetical protein
VAPGYYHFPDYLTALQAAGALFALGADGRATGQGLGDIPIRWLDRTGWLLGWPASEPGDLAPDGMASVAPTYSPACIPCLGGTWATVDVEREEVTVLDRQRRAHGYLWGGSEVIRVDLVLSAESYAALREGYLLRGLVRLAGSSTEPWSGEEPGGYIEGVCLGIQSAEWAEPTTQLVALVTLILARSRQE